MKLENNILKSLYGENELVKIFSGNLSPGEISGNGEKELLIIIRKNESTDENLSFLRKIMKATGFDLESDSLLLKVNQEDSPNVSTISRNVRFSQIFSFGISLKEMGLNLDSKKYYPFRWNDYRILEADGLTDLQNDEKLKRALWGVLKNWNS